MFSTTSLEQVTLEVGAICLSTCNLPVGWCVEPPPCSLSLSLNSPSQRLPWLTVCWFHTGGCYTVRPLWTCVPGSPAPWTPWRTWSGNLCRPLRNLAAAALCLSVIGFTQHNSKIVHFFERLLLQHYKHKRVSWETFVVSAELFYGLLVGFVTWQKSYLAGLKILTWDAGAKLVRKLRDEVIVDPIFHRSKHDDWPRVINCNMQTERDQLTRRRMLS